MASLNYCREELRSIIRELRAIEAGVRSEFIGIGQDICADCIDGVADKYESVLRKLNGVDLNALAESFNKDN